jgi:hypothetical protein
MNIYGVDLLDRRRRRRHSVEFKTAVIQECLTPGVSIAAVARAHSLNANMLRKWLVDAEQAGRPTPASVAAPEEVRLSPPSFIPLAFKAQPVAGDTRTRWKPPRSLLRHAVVPRRLYETSPPNWRRSSTTIPMPLITINAMPLSANGFGNAPQTTTPATRPQTAKL